MDRLNLDGPFFFGRIANLCLAAEWDSCPAIGTTSESVNYRPMELFNNNINIECNSQNHSFAHLWMTRTIAFSGGCVRAGPSPSHLQSLLLPQRVAPGPRRPPPPFGWARCFWDRTFQPRSVSGSVPASLGWRRQTRPIDFFAFAAHQSAQSRAKWGEKISEFFY